MSKSKKLDLTEVSYGKKKNKDTQETFEGRSFEQLFNEGVDLYQRGVSGDGKSAQKAVRVLEHLRKQKSSNSLVDAYYGASNCLMGKYEKNPMNKGKWISDGLNIVDQAQKRDPNNVKVRILRAYACFHLPAYFNRLGTAIEDFEYLLERNAREPGLIAEQTIKKISSNLQLAQKKYRK